MFPTSFDGLSTELPNTFLIIDPEQQPWTGELLCGRIYLGGVTLNRILQSLLEK
jgi:hypothetical protein